MLLLASALLLTCAPFAHQRADTLDVQRLAAAPIVDGRVDDTAYGASTLQIPTAAGEMRVWLGRHGDFFYLAASIPDSTFYWGDDLVVSLDANGSGGAAPGDGDRQWYLRRRLDSSVVATAANGRWSAPGAQQVMLGASRGGADWDAAATSSAKGWSVELRLRTSVLEQGAGAPRLALRTYNDQPSGWWSWPAPPLGMPAQRVERTPDLWITLRLR